VSPVILLGLGNNENSSISVFILVNSISVFLVSCSSGLLQEIVVAVDGIVFHRWFWNLIRKQNSIHSFFT
jgi:hypothetical protein